jgi:uncharacterized membrane protein YesL
MAKKLSFFSTIGKNLGASFVEMYKSMGFSLIIDLFWFIGYTPIFMVALISLQAIHQPPQPGDILQSALLFLFFFCIWHSLVASPLVTAVYALYQERKVEYPGIKMFWELYRKFYWRSVKIYGLFSLGVSLLLLNAILALYFTNFLFLVAGIASFYILLFIIMMSFYFNPLIHLGNSFKKVLRKSFLLVLDNLLISLGFVLVFGIILILCVKFVLFMFLLLIIYGPLLIYFTDRCFEAVYGRYDS